MMVYVDIKELIEILSIKLKLLEDIYKLTCDQSLKLDNEEIEDFIKILNSRELRINKIKQLDKRYDDILNRIKKEYKINDLTQIDDKQNIHTLQSLQDNIHKLLQNIHKVDKINKEKFDIEFSKVKDNMKSIKKGRKVTSSYYKIPTQVGGYFIDNKK